MNKRAFFIHWEYLKLLAENRLFDEFPFPRFKKKIFADGDANIVSMMRIPMFSPTSTEHLCSSATKIALMTIKWSAFFVACLTKKVSLSSLTLSIAIRLPLLQSLEMSCSCRIFTIINSLNTTSGAVCLLARLSCSAVLVIFSDRSSGYPSKTTVVSP
ncbi:hypothetical protein AVEN_231075-1 [Araneus ventricosus]|uniref:Uncharacterized protein n=1 Tax=Araneus ventricosus TaxID=182803 RepID=A0A4Y2A451_ARAVE|nr:hypothetical protein AVEN_231075-1 [Araneus ventricosus]